MKNPRLRHIVLVAVAALAVLCAPTEAYAQTAGPRPVGRIAVSAKGTITFDGAAVAMDALRSKLEELRQREGVVWYYRESSRGEPPPQASEVIKLVVEQRLAISMSTKPDYSDLLLPDGTTRPRDLSARP